MSATITLLWFFLIVCVLSLWPPVPGAKAAEVCEPGVGRVVSAQGRVELLRSGATLWQPAELEVVLCQGDTIRAGGLSRAAVALSNDTVLRIDQQSTLRLVAVAEPAEESFTLLSLVRGALQLFSRTPRQLEIDTPYLNGSIEGTEFVVRVEDRQTVLTVFEGRVVAVNEHGQLTAEPGDAVIAAAGRAPQPRLVVRPRDAARWALYYPPLLAVGGAESDLSATLRGVFTRAAGGDFPGAFAALDRVAETDRDARFYLYRAALLLAVGRADEARAEIDRALTRGPDEGLAYALRAVIGVTQNDRAQALADARRAVELNPRAAAPKIALSYAQQAGFQIRQARDTLLLAVEQQPQAALAWARLSELWLMLGDRDRAATAAQRALALAPDLERVQLALGFAALAEFDNAAARSAFGRAVALDSADPLAHLGLGLAEISSGDLAAGRGRLEAAVALDSNSALLRAYLGKAYFEQKRSPLDGEQFAIAKTLDPLDPTAFLYDGIRKQTENRPVEALRELEASIERNDNRAAYRGRLLLDKDRAARGTSLARVYSDLGFPRLGVIEATKSLALDPGNASSHRFLSDSYRDLRRHEVARVSELLQAQLLQDVNINPVQPSNSETNLNIVTQGGPASPGFGEFTPLFQRNEARLDLAGFGGSHDTYGGEAVVSALFGRYSLSAGGFFYDTEGFRDNSDLRHEIFNFYAQAAATPEFNVQAELRRRESDHGDLELNFDPDDFDPDFVRYFEEDSARFGLRLSPDPSSQLLFSFVYSDREEKISDRDVIMLPEFNADLSVTAAVEEKGYQYEGAYLWQSDLFNFNAGFAYTRDEQELIVDTVVELPFGVEQTATAEDRDFDDTRVYLYGNITAPDTVTWTLGLGYQDFDADAFEIEEINPKFGVQWDVTDALRLRAAYFQVIKPALATNRTIEPTQVAGFNQLFDDANGTRSRRYGIALDWRASQHLYLGAEASERDIEQAVLAGDAAFFEDREERQYRAYAYWTPSEHWSLGAAAVYDRYRNDQPLNPDSPSRVETFSLPLRAQYFHPSGVLGALGVTYVDQDVTRSETSAFADGDSDFAVVDVLFGYRFANRAGIASLAVQNLFDENFRYQDDSFRTFQDEPSVGPYIPERTITARFTLNF